MDKGSKEKIHKTCETSIKKLVYSLTSLQQEWNARMPDMPTATEKTYGSIASKISKRV